MYNLLYLVYINNETLLYTIKFLFDTEKIQLDKDKKDKDKIEKSITKSLSSKITALTTANKKKKPEIKSEQDLIDPNRSSVKVELDFNSLSVTLFTNAKDKLTVAEFGNFSVTADIKPVTIVASGHFGYLYLTDLREKALPEYKNIIEAGNKEEKKNFINFDIKLYTNTKHEEYPGYDVIISLSLNHMKAIVNSYYFISLLSIYLELGYPIMKLASLQTSVDTNKESDVPEKQEDLAESHITDYDLGSLLPLIDINIGDLTVIIPRYETHQSKVIAGIEELKVNNIKPSSKSTEDIYNSLSKLSISLNNLYLSSHIHKDNETRKNIILGKTGFTVDCVLLKDVSVNLHLLPLCFVLDSNQLNLFNSILNDNFTPLLDRVGRLPSIGGEKKELNNTIESIKSKQLDTIPEIEEEKGTDNKKLNIPISTTSIDIFFTAVTLEAFQTNNPYDDTTDSLTIQQSLGKNNDSLCLFQIGEMILALRMSDSIGVRYQLRDITFRDTRHNVKILDNARDIIKFGALGEPALVASFDMKTEKDISEIKIDANVSEIYFCPTNAIAAFLKMILSVDFNKTKIENDFSYVDKLLDQSAEILSETLSETSSSLIYTESGTTQTGSSISRSTSISSPTDNNTTNTKLIISGKFKLTNISLFFFQDEEDPKSFVLACGIGCNCTFKMKENNDISIEVQTERLYGCVIKTDLIIPPINDNFCILSSSMNLEVEIKNKFRDIDVNVKSDKKLLLSFSYQDIMIMSGAVNTLMECMNEITPLLSEETNDNENKSNSPNNSNSSGLSSIKLKGKISIPGLSILLLLDTDKDKYPILAFTIDKIVIDIKKISDIELNFIIYSFYYNAELAVFEPLIEKWSLTTQLLLSMTGKNTNVSINVKSDKVLELNISVLLCKSLLMLLDSINNYNDNKNNKILKKGNNNIIIHNDSMIGFSITVPRPDISHSTYSSRSFMEDSLMNYSLIRLTFCNIVTEKGTNEPAKLYRDSIGYHIQTLFNNSINVICNNCKVNESEKILSFKSDNGTINIKFLSESEFNIWKDIANDNVGIIKLKSSILNIINDDEDSKYINNVWGKEITLNKFDKLDTGYQCNPSVFNPSAPALSRKIRINYESFSKEINVDRSGYTLCNVNDDTNVLVEVISKDGNKNVYIRSNNDINNELDEPILIDYIGSDEQTITNQEIKKGERGIIPFMDINRGRIVLTHSEYGTCSVFIKDWINLRDENYRTRHEYHTADFENNNTSKKYSILVDVHIINTIDKYYPNIHMKIHSITLRYPFYIYNTLLSPINVKLFSEGYDFESSLNQGEFKKLCLGTRDINKIKISLGDSEETLKLDSPQNLVKDKVSKLQIQKNGHRDTITYIIDKNPNNSYSIYLYHEVWVINQSSSPLYVTNNKINKPLFIKTSPLQLVQEKPEKDEDNNITPVNFPTFSKENKLFFSADENGHSWSNPVNPLTVGVSVANELEDKQKNKLELIISSYIGSGVYSHTIIVRIIPKYYIWNLTDDIIEINQSKCDFSLKLEPKASSQFNWSNPKGDKYIQLKPSEEEYNKSGLCKIDTLTLPIVVKGKNKNKKYYTISHTIKYDMTIFIIQKLDINKSLYVIDNNTLHFTIIAHPRNCEESNAIRVRPLENKGYAWKDPLNANEIVLTACKTTNTDYKNYKIDTYKPAVTSTTVISFDKNLDQKIISMENRILTATVRFTNSKRIITIKEKTFSIFSLRNINHYLDKLGHTKLKLNEEISKNTVTNDAITTNDVIANDAIIQILHCTGLIFAKNNSSYCMVTNGNDKTKFNNIFDAPNPSFKAVKEIKEYTNSKVTLSIYSNKNNSILGNPVEIDLNKYPINVAKHEKLHISPQCTIDCNIIRCSNLNDGRNILQNFLYTYNKILLSNEIELLTKFKKSFKNDTVLENDLDESITKIQVKSAKLPFEGYVYAVIKTENSEPFSTIDNYNQGSDGIFETDEKEEKELEIENFNPSKLQISEISKKFYITKISKDYEIKYNIELGSIITKINEQMNFKNVDEINTLLMKSNKNVIKYLPQSLRKSYHSVAWEDTCLLKYMLSDGDTIQIALFGQSKELTGEGINVGNIIDDNGKIIENVKLTDIGKKSPKDIFLGGRKIKFDSNNLSQEVLINLNGSSIELSLSYDTMSKNLKMLDLSLDVNLPGIGVSLISYEPRDLLYLTVRDISANVSYNEITGLSLKSAIHTIQIDNIIPSILYPVLLYTEDSNQNCVEITLKCPEPGFYELIEFHIQV